MKPLIPQRDPIVMVDDVVLTDNDHASTTLLLTEDKYVSRESALVEFAAQSCAALIGCRSMSADLGYIGEVRNFEVLRIPAAGQLLHCELEVIAEMGGITLVQADIQSEGERMAQGRLKLFIHE